MWYLFFTFCYFTVLEDDYDRKRWDRKFRKFRGRPKKRSKREVKIITFIFFYFEYISAEFYGLFSHIFRTQRRAV